MAGLSAPATAPSSARERAIACAIGAALTFALTFPTIPAFARGGRFDSGDGRFSIWNVAWVAHALIEDPRHLLDANIFYPHRGALAYSEMNLVAGAIGAPVYAATRNPVAAHNAAVIVSLFAAFVAMWALVRRLTGSSAAALVSATAYAFSAFTSSHTAEIQLLMLFGFPLVMIAFHRVVDRRDLRSGAMLGAALALNALASGYYGVFAGGMIAAATGWWARRDPRYWVSIAAAAIVAALCVAPALVPYVRAQSEAGALRAKSANEARVYSAGWRDYLTTGTVAGAIEMRAFAVAKHAVLPAVAMQPRKEVLFPGLAVCALAAIGLAIGRRGRPERRTIVGYAAIAVLALWGSFGPDAGLYRLMMATLPGSGFLRAPVRLGIVVIFAVSVLAGVGVSALAVRRRWIAPLCLAAVAIEAYVPWPLQPMAAPERAYQMLRTLPRGGVVEFPFPYMPLDFHSHTKAMIRSTANWQPLVNGYSDYIPDDFQGMALPINQFPDPASFDILRAHDVRYVIFRVAEYGRGEYRQRLLDRFPPYAKYLRRLTDDQDVWLFEVVGWPPPAAGATGATD